MTQGAIQPGADIVFANGPSTNLPAWKLRYGGDSGLDIQLVRFDSSGAPVDVSVTVDWATGNVTLVTDLTIDDVTLDDATINDLTVTGTHIFTAASALLDIGATAVGSAGSPNVNLKKLATGTASLTLQSVEAGAYATRGLVRLDASENIIIQHNDTSAVEDATVTIGADAVTIAAATTTLGDASPTLAIGHATAASGGSPVATLRKGAAGTASINLQSNEGGTYRTRGLVQCNASEALILQHNDATGAEDATVTVGADAVTVAAILFSLSDASPQLNLGSGAGSPFITLEKTDAGVSVLGHRVGGIYRGSMVLDASEVVQLQHHDAGGTADAVISMSAALVNVATGVLLTSGGLRTGYRSLGADAAATLAATDDVVELNSGAGSKAVTMTATAAGHVVRVYATTVTGGDYTLACTRGATGGTVTLNATGEGCVLSYSGSSWKLLELTGGATFA